MVERPATELVAFARSRLVERRANHNKATIALANKMARQAWVVLNQEQRYCPTH